MTTSVLIGYDGSEGADRAMRAARSVLSADRVVIATVWESSLPMLIDSTAGQAGSGAMMADPATADVLDHAAETSAHRVTAQGAALARSLGFTAIEEVAVEDSSNTAITLSELATTHGAQTIVVGSHGHGAIYARLMGTTSTALIRHAHCPVLVVPSTTPDRRGA